MSMNKKNKDGFKKINNKLKIRQTREEATKKEKIKLVLVFVGVIVAITLFNIFIKSYGSGVESAFLGS